MNSSVWEKNFGGFSSRILKKCEFLKRVETFLPGEEGIEWEWKTNIFLQVW